MMTFWGLNVQANTHQSTTLPEDTALTVNNVAIIEGNNYCAHDFWQLPGQTPGGIGIIPKIKEVAPEWNY